MKKLLIMLGMAECIVSYSYAEVSFKKADVVAYLNSLNDFKADFTQSTNGGRPVNGNIKIVRPNMDLNIGTLTIHADNKGIEQYNSRLKEKSRLNKNPYKAFLQKNANWNNLIKIDHLEREGENLHAKIRLKNVDLPVCVRLHFATKDGKIIELKGWTIVHGNNNRIDVNITGIDKL